MKFKIAISSFFNLILSFVHLLGSISSIVGLAYVYYYDPETLDKRLIPVIIFSLILVVFVIDSFYLRYKNRKLKEKEKRYKKIEDACNRVSMGLAKINLAQRALEEISPRERKQILQDFLNELSTAFTILCDSPCAVSINVPIRAHNSNTPFFTILCRDTNIKRRIIKSKDSTKQQINENTPYEYLLQNLHLPTGRFFLENNLPLKRGFKSSSFKLFSNYNFRGLPDELSNKKRLKAWRLPFKSIVVVPILPHPDIENIHQEQNLDYKGFLTVDCRDKDAFVGTYDVELLVSAADCIYNYVNDFLNILKQQTEKAKSTEAI